MFTKLKDPRGGSGRGAGRPPKIPGHKTSPLTLAIDVATMAWIDASRGELSRSVFVLKTLRAASGDTWLKKLTGDPDMAWK